jgi:NAD(P)-dependent dehydrogenase (short-subunit alcohol dehydrogenase family)
MDIAIVTGAETPLGLRLIEDLIRQGCRVHGIGNNFSNVTFSDPNFVAHAIDLSDLSAVAKTVETILDQENAIHILIHAIDVTPGAAFEQLPIGNLEAILKVGLLGPVMLTRIVLPNLLRFRGQLLNIIPANKSGHTPSAVNALIEGGLQAMNAALFDQARDAGLRVTNLILRQNTVDDDAAFADKHLQTHIDPDHVARTVERLLDPNEPNVPNEITLYPRISAAAQESLPETTLPIDPYTTVVLPPKEYFPPKQEAIATREADRIERTIPYSDEEMEEKIASAIEDFESHPERYQTPKKPKKKTQRKERSGQSTDSKGAAKQPASSSNKADLTSSEHEQSDQSNQSKSRRGRRRGGRNRNPKGNAPDPRKVVNQESPADSATAKPAEQGDQAQRSRRNRNRKQVVRPEEKYATYDKVTGSKPKATQGTFQPREVAIESAPAKQATKPSASTTNKPPAAKPKPLERAAESRAPKKKAAKKVTKPTSSKKVAVKKAAKKTSAKKVAKKTATKKATKRAAKKAVKKAKIAD